MTYLGINAASLTRDVPKEVIETEVAAAACETDGAVEVVPIPEVEVEVPEVEACAAEEPQIESVVIPDSAYPDGYDAESIIF